MAALGSRAEGGNGYSAIKNNLQCETEVLRDNLDRLGRIVGVANATRTDSRADQFGAADGISTPPLGANCSGKLTMNEEPWPTALSTATRPPNIALNDLTI